jgi:hypothetical protein
MLLKINRANCLKHYPILPWSKYQGNKFFFPAVCGQYVISLQSKTARGHCKNLSAALQVLMQKMQVDKLIFLGDTTTPWLFREKDFDYKPVAEAFAYLKNHKISSSFNGGLLVNTANIATFMQHLFWLERCNGVVQYVHAVDEKQHILFNICKYGNLHFYVMNEASDVAFNAILPSTGLHFLQAPSCYETFSKSGRIQGRTIIV